MANPQNYQRDANGIRFQPGGMDTVHPLDALPPGKYAYLQNVRAYKQLQLVGRSTESAALVSGLLTPVHSLRLLNDTSPNGPVGGYVRVIGAAGAMYVNSTGVASGLSGNPVALCPFRPNASVQPWMYTGDSSQAVTIPAYIASGYGDVTGMLKIRSDGLTQKTGVKEPQTAPLVSTSSTTTSGTDALPATAVPWNNVNGANPGYNYGQTNAADGTSPIIVTGDGPALLAGSTITLTVTGSATVNGATHAPADAGPTGPSYPGGATGISGTPSIIVAAFTNASGTVIAPGGSLPLVAFVGAGTTLTVPTNAAQLQVGIDSSANTFSANSGSFTLHWTVTTSAIATVISTLGNVTAYVWGSQPNSGSGTGGGSPTSKPVATYIWKNPGDVGSGTPRSITDPVPDKAPTNNSWVFDSSPQDGTVPVNWNVLNPDGTIASAIPMFNPQLESAGYQDFNCCVVGSLFVPAADTYAFSLQYKDQVMLGMSAGATLVSTSGTPPLLTSPIGSFGQTMSVVSALPLLFVSAIDGLGAHHTTTLNIKFAAAGVYQVEVDWDYWYHTGRSLILTCVQAGFAGSPTIPPLPQGVRTGVQYRYTYRSSATGALSNPSPESVSQATPVLANTMYSVYSLDPQVDKVDYYRIDSAITSFTYVATGPNDGLGGTIGGIVYNTPVTDELSDTAIAGNPLLQFDNFEPFPVLDLPKNGVVNVSGGTITWVSGNTFNTRWLPGTLIQIGYPTSLTYTLIARPTSTTSMAIPGVPDGTNLVYSIPEPILAQQALSYLWGPTENTAYMFGVGDTNNPGTLYFTKGNNPDSAPDTNSIVVTSPAEPLMNGCITAGLGMVFSTERRWLIYPTFTTALATVSGVAGAQFNLVLAQSDRGLYIATCLCTDGGSMAFYRAKDGIYSCTFGGGDTFLCADIYNLFPREGVTPSAVTVAGHTIYPPDDTKPSAQKLAYANGYLYYDYEDTTSTPRTLVFDQFAGGWSVDVGQHPFTVHELEEGPQTNTTMVGCSDGTVRTLGSGNTETATSVVIPGAQNAGDARAFKRLGDVFVKALVAASNPITVALYANQYAQLLTGFSPTSLTGTGTLLPYIVDFTAGYGDDLIDMGLALSWNTQAGNVLDLWQPDFIALPESVQDRVTDWSNGGYIGAKFVQGVRLERNTFGQNKVFWIQSSDDLSLNLPNETPCNFNGQNVQAFSVSPFIAHNMRIVSTDGVPWNEWTTEYVFQPYPEQCLEWTTELMSYGPGWQHIRMFNVPYIATAAVTMTLFFDQWPTITITGQLPATASQLYPTKTKVQCPANKSKLMGFTLSSTALFRVFKPQLEVMVGIWGRTSPYEIVRPFGGSASDGADV